MSSIASSSTPKRARPAATVLRSHLAGALTRAEAPEAVAERILGPTSFAEPRG